uniref:DUF834 domain-containing protein n=1 Tax=Oryza barthii TaxID=65489 RepID=A0A0D3GET5_9ORYZ
MAKPSGWPNCSTGWPNVASLLHWLKVGPTTTPSPIIPLSLYQPRADSSDGGVGGAEGHGGLVPVAGDLGHALRAHGVLDPPGIGGLLGVARVVLGEQVVVEGDEDAGKHVSGARLWRRGWDEIEEVGRVDMGGTRSALGGRRARRACCGGREGRPRRQRWRSDDGGVSSRAWAQ